MQNVDRVQRTVAKKGHTMCLLAVTLKVAPRLVIGLPDGHKVLVHLLKRSQGSPAQPGTCMCMRVCVCVRVCVYVCVTACDLGP